MSSRTVCRLVAALVLVLAVPARALANDRPIDVMVPTVLPPGTSTAVSSNVIFMNRCASGCAVHQSGTTDSRSDSSTIGGGNLSAFNCGDPVWAQVMACMKDVFAPYNVVITDVDPGSTTHLEVMVAGTPQELGQGSNVGGIAPFPCASYMQNALVFDFGNFWQCNVEEICSTAAQEIAHTWALDHVTTAADPMTYFGFNGRRYFATTASQCGSDCTNGQAPLGQGTCSGSPAQLHNCYCSNQPTENTDATIKALFGPGTILPPVVKITKPLSGAAVAPSFAVVAEVTDATSVISKVELRVDGTLVQPVLMSMPYAFNAPSVLANGSHHVEVTGYDRLGTPGKAAIDVIIGPPCTKPADCPLSTDTCIAGRCVAGPGVQGGLGMACTNGSQCASGQCASDGTNMYCVESCMKGECPATFGCLDTGNMMGVCWPGYDDGSGGGCSVGSGGPITLGLLFASLVFVRRRRS